MDEEVLLYAGAVLLCSTVMPRKTRNAGEQDRHGHWCPSARDSRWAIASGLCGWPRPRPSRRPLKAWRAPRAGRDPFRPCCSARADRIAGALHPGIVF